MRGGWRSYEAKFIKHIPIHKINQEDPVERACFEEIVRMVNLIIAQPSQSLVDIELLKAEIDQQVYTLYGLSSEEISIVKGVDSALQTDQVADLVDKLRVGNS